MEFTAPISRFMSRKMITVAPGDRMTLVKEIFEKNRIHHLPVVRHNSLVGIISKQDYMHFLRGDNQSPMMSWSSKADYIAIAWKM